MTEICRGRMPLDWLRTHWWPADRDWDTCRAGFVNVWHYRCLVQSVRRDGLHTPVILGYNGWVWDGRHRVYAAGDVGLDIVPFVLDGPKHGREPDAWRGPPGGQLPDIPQEWRT